MEKWFSDEHNLKYGNGFKPLRKSRKLTAIILIAVVVFVLYLALR